MNLIGVLKLGGWDGGKRTQTESKKGASEFVLVVHVPYYE
jgi:hypothetical protein